MQTFNPYKSILAVFRTEPCGDGIHKIVCAEHLGSGFFLGEEGIFITCAHVIRGFEKALVVVMINPATGEILPFLAELKKVDEEIDLAALIVDRYRPDQEPLRITEDPIAPNRQVTCFEYSTTGPALQARGKIHVDPATRVGNVTRILDRQGREKRFDQALEVSFAVLAGASGAPILSENMSVMGVAFGNIDYEVKPVKSLVVRDEKNKIHEETQYMLPLGLAINRMHVKEFLRDL